MKIAPLGEVKNYFTRYIKISEKGPIFITKNGRISAVLEHLTDDNVEDYLLERSEKFRKMLDSVKGQKGGITLAEYKRTRNLPNKKADPLRSALNTYNSRH